MMIETGRLILREYTLEDFNALYEILSDPETMRHYPAPYDEKGTRRWLEWSLENYKKHGFGWWAIELKQTGEFIGDCGVTMQPIDGESLPELGYHLNRKYWRRGYAGEAAAAVRDWFFQNTEFECIYSYMTAANMASWATAARTGLRRIKEYEDETEGLLYVYAMTRDEWKSTQK